jgi:hypothetical protein
LFGRVQPGEQCGKDSIVVEGLGVGWHGASPSLAVPRIGDGVKHAGIKTPDMGREF